MKIAKLLTCVFMLFALQTTAHAQTTPADVLKEWERAKAYTKDYLEAMPETGYALKPTPVMRSFADKCCI